MNTSSPRCTTRASARLLACLSAATLSLAGTATAQQGDCVTFDDLATGLVLTSGVFTEGGIGPIRVTGNNPALGATNAAIIFDSSMPTGEDPDLGTPNEDFGGPGIGVGGEAGSPFQNDTELFKIAIIAEDLVDTSPADGLVDDPDDSDQPGTLEFGFSIVGPVVIRSLTVIDIEEDRDPAYVELFNASNVLLLTFPLTHPGDNGVSVNVFPPNGNVSRMLVHVDGSGGFDNLCLELYVDCNGNGVHDPDDIANGTSEDCDGNGIPDECDPDCDGDGTPDACEVDCDGDGVPDECDTEPDCNENMVPDNCDIANGTSTDLNMNGIPDECDPDCDGDGIPDDIRLDCDGDGIPDDCEDDCDGDGIPDDCDTEPDCNNNGIPDNCDITNGAPDCDGNGVPDECDPDCDGDGTPDACEPDCDGDGIPDDCEADCDGDGIPDDCEPDCDSDGIPDDCEPDCDGDGFPDDCDSEPDCNDNGIPDNCDITDGTSDDVNGNGIPDECEEVGIPYCDPNLPNSTGQSGMLLCTGSNIAADEDLTLTAYNLPPGNICLFIASMNQGLIQPPRSCGNLCLMGPDIARFKFDAQVVGEDGQCSLTIDPWVILTNPPQPILAGQTWYFQGWHRDADAGPDCNNNFTNACCITFL